MSDGCVLHLAKTGVLSKVCWVPRDLVRQPDPRVTMATGDDEQDALSNLDIKLATKRLIR